MDSRKTDDPVSGISAGQGYDVHYFAQKHGLSVERAQELMRRSAATAGTARNRLS